MNKDPTDSFLFKPAQFLGTPAIFPPELNGKIPVSVQFIIPGFHVSEKSKSILNQIAQQCESDVLSINVKSVINSNTKQSATMITIAFYATSGEDTKEHPIDVQINFKSRILVERFVSLLSFFAGSKLSAVHIQSTTKNNGQYIQHLPVIRRTETPKTQIEFFNINKPSDDTFSAFSWLRRGLAERDPIETFSALMVCLQILARQLVESSTVEVKCTKCGNLIEKRQPSISSMVRTLLVSKLGASEKLFKDLWKARNAIISHGNVAITPDILLRLTELKFEAAKLAYQGLSLSLGIPANKKLSPNQAFFITDAFMYID